MELSILKEKLEHYKKGSYIKICWQKRITLKNGDVVFKTSSSVERLGINYGNLPVIKKRNELKNFYESNEKINYKQTDWVIKNYIKHGLNGKNLLVVYPTKKHYIKNEYKTLDGKIIDNTEIESLMYYKDKNSSINKTNVFYLNIDDIISI